MRLTVVRKSRGQPGWVDGGDRAGETGEKAVSPAPVVLKPMPLVSGFPMLDHAFGNAGLLASIEVERGE